jgi:hypothetical protein
VQLFNTFDDGKPAGVQIRLGFRDTTQSRALIENAGSRGVPLQRSEYEYEHVFFFGINGDIGYSGRKPAYSGTIYSNPIYLAANMNLRSKTET